MQKRLKQIYVKPIIKSLETTAHEYGRQRLKDAFMLDVHNPGSFKIFLSHLFHPEVNSSLQYSLFFLVLPQVSPDCYSRLKYPIYITSFRQNHSSAQVSKKETNYLYNSLRSLSKVASMNIA